MSQEILVVKLGGGEGLDVRFACDDLATLARQRPLVVVHGVSVAANRLCEERNIPVQMLTSPSGHSSRYTNPQTRDVYVQAAERVNHELVSGLQILGIKTIGLIGAETAIHGTRKHAIRALVNGHVRLIHDDYSGTITQVDADRLRQLLQDGFTPVLPPMAASSDGLLNVDGDRASGAVAGALGAETLVILSNVRGLFRNFPDENSFVPQVAFTQIATALNWAQGRMKRKVLGAQDALGDGVQRVILADGRVAHPVQRALAGEGTVFTR